MIPLRHFMDNRGIMEIEDPNQGFQFQLPWIVIVLLKGQLRG
jgi:hypothetical protein